jgi:hypothetical protein
MHVIDNTNKYVGMPNAPTIIKKKRESINEAFVKHSAAYRGVILF